jgi:RNA polymerase sigma factor (sigma-70 family)
VTPDAAALATEWHPHAVAVARRAKTWLSRPEAESVAGEAVCEAAQTWVDRNLAGDFGGWLNRIVHRRLVEETRGQFGRRGQRFGLVRAQSLETPIGDGLTLDGVLAEPDDPFGRLDDVLAAEWRAGRVRKAIDGRLSRSRRKAVLLLAEGRLQYEVAEELGITPSRVCQIVAEVREQLADLQGP